MKLTKIVLALALLVTFAGCSTYDTGSENAPYKPWWVGTEFEKEVEQF